jgi:hypothetical protein
MANRGRYTRQNLFFYDVARGGVSPSQSLWSDCPMLPWLCDPTLMHVYFNDFHSANKATEEWILTQAVSGTAVAGTLAGGVFTLGAGATTNHQGPNVQLAGVDFVPAAGKDIWFEARVKVNVLTGRYFVGLAELDTTIIASGAMTTDNHIGFSSLAGAGVVNLDSEKATAGLATTAVHTFVADTYVKLGFKVSGVTSIQAYVNGVAVGDPNPTANVPIVGLTPSLVVHATGTGTPAMDIDWIRVAQLR